jgi:hypothetical protein
LNEGRRIDDYVIKEEAGPFWSPRWTNDDDIQDYYAKYFPDDIPDEWSFADISKSHGPGTKGEATLSRLGTIWMTDESVFAWSADTHVASENPSMPFHFCDIAAEKLIDGASDSHLQSRRKQLLIV